MDNNEKKEGFNLTYSAKQMSEVKRIREKYLPEDKTELDERLEKIKKLDRSVVNRAMAYSITVGVVGALLMGVGMCFCMVPEFSSALSISELVGMIIGIPVGIVGIAIASSAYSVYRATLDKMRKKVAPEILKLTDDMVE